MLSVLWLDDDTPKGERQFGEVLVHTAQTCSAAAQRLESKSFDWVVVDLVVPQGGWRADDFYKVPGIQFIEYVNTSFDGRVKTAAYSIALSPERSVAAREAGATITANKSQVGFTELLSLIVAHSSSEERLEAGLRRLVDGNPASKEQLEDFIRELTEAQLSLGRRLSPKEIQALHLAKIAVDRQGVEEQKRSLQTLASILYAPSAEDDLPGATDTWREKLAFLLKERASASDPEQKFRLDREIQEIQEILRGTGGDE